MGKYILGGAGSGSEWIAAGRLFTPLVVVSLFVGAFVYFAKRVGWLPIATSVAPISIMLGLLSYTIIFFVDPMITGGLAPRTIWRGILFALIITWPIAFVMGPVFFVYIVRLKKGQGTLRDSTVFYLSVLCLIAEAAYVRLLFGDS